MIPSIVMNLFDDRLMGKRRAIATVTRAIAIPAGILFESKLESLSQLRCNGGCPLTPEVTEVVAKV
jgi:hypothetical protein